MLLLLFYNVLAINSPGSGGLLNNTAGSGGINSTNTAGSGRINSTNTVSQTAIFSVTVKPSQSHFPLSTQSVAQSGIASSSNSMSMSASVSNSPTISWNPQYTNSWHPHSPSISNIPTVTSVSSQASMSWDAQSTPSYEASQTSRPTRNQSIIPQQAPQQSSIYDSYKFIVGGSVTGGLVLVGLITYLYLKCRSSRPTLSSEPPLTINPLRPTSIIENGKIYYFDGNSGKLLAEGWQRHTDHTGDTWYTNDKGHEPSWVPIYKQG